MLCIYNSRFSRFWSEFIHGMFLFTFSLLDSSFEKHYGSGGKEKTARLKDKSFTEMNNMAIFEYNGYMVGFNHPVSVIQAYAVETEKDHEALIF